MKKFLRSFLLPVILVLGIAFVANGGDITGTGMYQKDIFTFLSNTVTAVNELKDDHGTSTTNDTNIKTLVNELQTFITGDRLLAGVPGLAISSNFDVATANTVWHQVSQVPYEISFGKVCDTGTAATFPTTTYGIFLVSAAANGDLTATWDTNSSVGYATEALAIAALPAVPASKAPIGYVTVEAHATGTFLAGTDALTGGSGGDVANATVYYDLMDPKTVVGSSVTTSSPAALSADDLSLTGL